MLNMEIKLYIAEVSRPAALTSFGTAVALPSIERNPKRRGFDNRCETTVAYNRNYSADWRAAILAL